MWMPIESKKEGVKVIQLHTGGMCHLDAEMTRQDFPVHIIWR